MTKTTKIYHARCSGVTIPGIPSATGGTTTGRVLRQFEEFEVGPELYAETLDRNGNSWIDLTPGEQVARWGSQKFAEGPAPEGAVIGGDDDLVMFERGMAALKLARATSDPIERAAAVKDAWATYGPHLRDLAEDLRR